MALKKTITKAGVEAVDAYHKVVKVEIETYGTTTKATQRVAAYANKAAADAAVNAEGSLSEKWYDVPDFSCAADESAKAQCYAALKADPDFADAADVLEEKP